MSPREFANTHRVTIVAEKENIMNIEQRTVGDVIILSIAGNITIGESRAVRLVDKVRSVLQQGDMRIVLDLRHVRHVDSGGLGELVRAHSIVRNQGGALKLLHATQKLSSLLVVTRLLTVFDCFDREAEAVASFEASAAPR